LIDLGFLQASATDLARLVALPVFGWAAVRDVRTRRVPNRTWVPLTALALVVLAVDARAAAATGGPTWELFVLQVGISVGFLVPFAYLFWWFGGFGGADAKAFMVIAVLLPTYPSYLLGPTFVDAGVPGLLPAVESEVGVFSLTVVTDAVLMGAAYPLAVTARNALRGRVTPVMFVGRPVAVDRLPTVHGRLLETPDGFTRAGLDLDALRMYLRWRGADFEALRERPGRLRDPATLPEEPNPPTDGAVATDGGHPEDAADPKRRGDGGADETAGDATTTDGAASGDGTAGGDGPTEADESSGAVDETADDAGTDYDDPWGAEAFLEDVGSAYGTTPESLRAGLSVLADGERERVWVSPGLPFIVPLFLGLVVAFTYGDLLATALRAVGLV
jgi:preflagellin peptidase FlaK